MKLWVRRALAVVGSLLMIAPWLATTITMPGLAAGATSLPGGGYVCGGKFLAASASATLYGQGTSPGEGCLSDQDEVYDTSLWIVITSLVPSLTPINLTAEQYTPTTTTVYENVTRGNTTSLVAVQVPAKGDPEWNNLTITLIPRSTEIVNLPLRSAGQERDLQITVDGTTWQLYHLTPAQSSLAWIYSDYGLNAVLIVEVVVTGVALLVASAIAWGAIRRTWRVPRIHFHWWPAAWAVIPVLLFFLPPTYVEMNQLLGAWTFIYFPIVIGMAAFPYLMAKDAKSKMVAVISYNTSSKTSGDVPLAIFPIVKDVHPLAAAPETWREWWKVLCGWPLPAISTTEILVDGKATRIEMPLTPVTYPLGAYYAIDADYIVWADSQTPVTRSRHKRVYHEDVRTKVSVKDLDGSSHYEMVTERRRCFKRQLGTLTGKWVDPKDVLKYMEGVLTIEQEAQDHEATQIELAHTRGKILRERREARKTILRVITRAAAGVSEPLTDAQLKDMIQAAGKAVDTELTRAGEVKDGVDQASDAPTRD